MVIIVGSSAVKISVGTIHEKSKKSESDSFSPAGKTRIDSDSIPGPTSPKTPKKTRPEIKAAQQSKNFNYRSKKIEPVQSQPF
jgi:hypothetical protein